MNPQVGKSVVSSRTFLQCENFFGIIVLQFVGHLLSSSMVGLLQDGLRHTLGDPGLPEQTPVPVTGHC